MQHRLWIGGAGLALLSGLAFAQEAPRSILPPGFENPAPTPTPTPTPRPTATATETPGAPAIRRQPGEIVQPLPAATGGQGAPRTAPPAAVPSDLLEGLPTLRELESLSTSELDELLGLKPRFDIPPAAQRSLARVGVIGADLGGLPSETLAQQPAQLVRAAVAGNTGRSVSRWGHIMLRRALASRLAAPQGMDPVEFAALRAGLLNRMGEHHAARALAQSVDAAEWNAALTNAAVEAYLGTADILGICPAANLRGNEGAGAQWQMLTSICSAYGGEATRAQSELERLRRRGTEPRIDVLLAQRYAAGAGTARRGFNIEWGEVEELTPWRFAFANAVGEPIPETLSSGLSSYYQRILATMPMVPAIERVDAAQLAARYGILSADAMVDLYSQIYASGEDRNEGPGLAAARLRTAYVDNDPGARLAAIRAIWGEGDGVDYGRQVLTSFAAARVTPQEALAADAAPLIASMLTAGLDRNALRWQGLVPEGSEAWALIALSAPTSGGTVDSGAVDDFLDADNSDEQRKSQFLVAGLAGLGRLGEGAAADFAEQLRLDFTPRTRWAQMIDRAAAVNNQGLVVLLAGLGMQGDSWERMTGRQLYQIVSALNRVGLSAEARMIAAEAVARG